MGTATIRKTLRAYQRAVTADPANVELRLGLATYLRAGNYTKEAAGELELCTKLLAARGEVAAAIACAKEMLAIAPERVEVLTFLSRHYAAHPDLARDARVARPLQGDDSEAQVSEEDEELFEIAVEPVEHIEVDEEGIDLTVLTLDPEESEHATLTPPSGDISAPFSTDELLQPPAPPVVSGPQPRLTRRSMPNAERPVINTAALASSPLFSLMAADVFRALVEHLAVHHTLAGEVIATSATMQVLDPATDETIPVQEPALRIVVSGRVVGHVRNEEGVTVALGNVEVGGFFGEFELLTGQSRDVQWTAETDSVLLVLPQSQLELVEETYPALRERLWAFYDRRLIQDFLASSKLFQPLETEEREALANKFRPRNAEPGEIVVYEGQESDGFYLIRDGEVEAYVDGEQVIATLYSGDFFGVHSVASGEPFKASVRSLGETTLLVLPAAVITQLLMLYPGLRRSFDALAEARAKLATPLVVGATGYSRGGRSPRG